MRLLILILLFVSLQSQGQVINASAPYRARAAAAACTSKLLDSYSGAFAAFSLRLLDCDYSGYAIRVRRSSDNTEQDIGFTNGNLDTTSLKSFIGANNGLVVKWYNQGSGGSTYDISQSTAGNQPIIISSGVISRYNGQPALTYTNGSGHRLVANFTTVTQPITAFSVVKVSDSTQSSVIFDGYNSTQFVFYYAGGENPNKLGMGAGTGSYSIGNASQTQQLFTTYMSGASSQTWANGSSFMTPSVGTNGLSGISVGHIRGNPSPLIGSYDFGGYLFELVLYNSDKTGDRTSIESNLNIYYSVY